MKIHIVSVGSRGDIQPYIALGKCLKNLGHEIKIVTTKNFKDFAEENDLEIIGLNSDPQSLLDTEQAKKMLEEGSNPIFSMNILMNIYKSELKEFLDSLMNVCNGAEAIIFSVTTFPCYYIAKKMKIPAIAAYLLPFNQTSEFPNIFVPNPKRFGSIFNKLSHIMVEQLLWQPIRKITNNWIKNDLGLEPIPFTGHSSTLNKLDLPFVYGFSKYVISKPVDWDKNKHITGYWYLDSNVEWLPDKKITDFIDDGEAPVYIGFGSMVSRNPELVAEMIINSVNKANKRAILLSGWGGLKKSDLPDNILMVDSIPHDWLFPKMSAVAHHCGAGTTAATLRAGKPAIPIPFFADQSFWANKMYDLGVATKPIDRKNLTSESLYQALKYVSSHKFLDEKAKLLSHKINSENGVKTASKFIDDYLKSKK